MTYTLFGISHTTHLLPVQHDCTYSCTALLQHYHSMTYMLDAS